MVYTNFEQLIHQVKLVPEKKRMAIAAAEDEHTLSAALRVQREGIVEPVFVGQGEVIEHILEDMGCRPSEYGIYDCSDPVQSAVAAVRLIKDGKADFLMKGRMDTSVFLKAVVNKTDGLSQGRTMSHFTMFEVPGYHKILAAVDGGMVPYPDLKQKRDIIDNTVEVFRALGYECPKVGVLACVEKVNALMPETVEAYELKRMNERGEIRNCIVEGPISYDCAVDKEIADFKGYKSPVAGDVDILLAPDIHTGNIMGKMFVCSCHARMAGFIVGASCPVIMTSRGSSAEEKYLSIVVGAAVI